MEGEASNSDRQQHKRSRQKRSSESLSYEHSVENLSKEGKDTLRIVNQNLRRSPLNTIQYTSSVVFDNTSPAYDWLPSGWIAEERVKSHGRLYRVWFLLIYFM